MRWPVTTSSRTWTRCLRDELGSLVNAYSALGQVERAIEHYQQALVIFEEIGSPSADRVQHWLAELEA